MPRKGSPKTVKNAGASLDGVVTNYFPTGKSAGETALERAILKGNLRKREAWQLRTSTEMLVSQRAQTETSVAPVWQDLGRNLAVRKRASAESEKFQLTFPWSQSRWRKTRNMKDYL